MPGLLDMLSPEDQQAVRQQQMYGLLGALGQAAMPTRAPIPIGAVLAQAAGGMNPQHGIESVVGTRAKMLQMQKMIADEELRKKQQAAMAGFSQTLPEPMRPLADAFPEHVAEAMLKKTFGDDKKTSEQRNWEFAQTLAPEERAAFLGGARTSPATIQEWEYFNKLSPQDQGRFIEMKRSPQVLNLGGMVGVRAPGGGIGEAYSVSPRPEDMPGFRGAQTAAIEQARTTAELGKEQTKKATQAGTITTYIDEADTLLDKAHGGLTGLAASKAKQAANISDEKTQADQQLKLLSGWMVSNVPRMEGPQSEYDVKNYQDMAAKVGDITVPVADRKAALKQLRKLQEKYTNTTPAIQAPTTQPPKQPQMPKFGEVRGGYYFKGGDPADPKNWVKK